MEEKKLEKIIDQLSYLELDRDIKGTINELVDEIKSLKEILRFKNTKIGELEHLVAEDVLLPIYNRRAFVEELSRSISMSKRYKTESTLVYFDVNNMKQINDTYGHEAGDRALLHVTQILRARVREFDVLGRIGGDEIGLILYQCNSDDGRTKAVQLANDISNNQLMISRANFGITVTFGTYTYSGDEDAARVLAKADKSMYEKVR